MRKFRITVRPIVAGAIILAAAGCFNALRQKPGIPESPPVTVEDRAVGEQLRDELLSRYPEDTQPEDRQQVLGVTSRLLDAAGDPNGWNITIFQDGAEVNAAASRGKQIFIWTGLLDAVNNDEELSTVLGHEIGHVLADHVADVQFGAQYSAEEEYEADRIGLLLMAEAGYDPKKALLFWQRIAAAAGPNSSPVIGIPVTGSPKNPGEPAGAEVFLSTHPSSEKRIRRIQAELAGAEERYQYAEGGRTH